MYITIEELNNTKKLENTKLPGHDKITSAIVTINKIEKQDIDISKKLDKITEFTTQ